MTGEQQQEKTVTRVVRFSVDARALTSAQAALFARHAGCARQAWNWATRRWHHWQSDLRAHVNRLAAEHVNLHHASTPLELADALVAAHMLIREKSNKWTDNAWASARRVHGDRGIFENAYTLQHIYRLTAANPHDHSSADGVEELHWWNSEGAQSGLPLKDRHGVSSSAYQTALEDFGKAVAAYWKNPRYSKRTGHRLGAPRPKRKTGDQGFAIKSLTPTGGSPWRMISDGHRIVVPNLGSIRLVQNTKPLRRLIQRGGKPTTARFTRRGGKWYVSINVAFPADSAAVQAPLRPTRAQRAGGTVGVDLGVNHLAVLSNGTFVANRKFLRTAQADIERLMRQRDRQHRAGSPDCFEGNGRHKKGGCTWGTLRGTPKSRRAQTTDRQIRRLHTLVAARRAGVLHDLTKHLATNFEVIGIEALDVRGMTGKVKPKPDPARPGQFLPNSRRAKGGLNRAILDAGFAEFRRQLEYKSQWYGSTVVTIDKFVPSSKTCSTCGAVKAKLPLGERTYTCSACGLVIDRDLNAALNIRMLVERAATPMEREQDVPVGVAEKRHGGTSSPSSAEETPAHRSRSSGVNEAREGPPTPNAPEHAA